MGRMKDVAMYVEEFTRQYIVTELWSGMDWYGREDEDDNPEPLDDTYGPEDISDKAMAEIREDCETFVLANWLDLASIDASQAGHDFSLTRNGHGAGFWDRGLGEVGERLTDASKPYGETYYFPTDGKLYLD